MITGDPCAFPQFSCRHDSSLVDSCGEGIRIPFTAEAGEFLSTILEQLADFPSPQRGALLLSGDLGVDNLHLLHYLERILANPEHPAWNALLQCLNLRDEARPKVALRALFVSLPPDSSEDPAVSLMDYFQQRFSDDSSLSSRAESPAEEIPAFMQRISSRMVERSLGVIILENISERIEQWNDAGKIEDELRLYKTLSEVFSQNGILAIFISKKGNISFRDQATTPLTGEKEINPGYSWIEATHRPSFTLPPNVPLHEEEFQEHLQLRIYEWIQTEIPSWRPECSLRYQRDSQALLAPIPEDETAPKGLVYFKSVFDPYWTDEDLARLQESIYAWVLMILNPCERFYEFETRLKEIRSRLPMLLIWRPDTPTKAELESLRGLVLEASATAAGEGPSTYETISKIHGMLAAFYIRRGQLMGPSDQQTMCDSARGRSVAQYLAVCLNRLPLQKIDSISQDSAFRAKAALDRQAMRWAALVTGDAGLEGGSVAHTQARLNEWWAKSVGGLSMKLPDFPEVFHTTRFWNDLKHIEGPLSALRPAFQGLRSGEISVLDAMDRVGRNFAWDEDRLQKWKQKLEGLEGLILWLSAFMHAREYLSAAFPLGRENPDRLREALLQSIEEPSGFLRAEARSEFERRFLEFKKSYMDIYCLLHEDTLYNMRAPKKIEARIDPVSLHNLDLLSGLQYTDKSYLNRVKLMAKWMQRNQCSLPLRQILEHYPRCYCNFSPCTTQHPAGSYARINDIILEGIEYFRSVLRRCRHLIMPEIKTQHLDDSTLGQVTSVLSDGPMVPLKPSCISALNGIIAKYPSQFLAEIRRGKQFRRRIH